jgi:hypothetical protein
MYPAQPSELLRSALSLLPPLPCSVEVLSPEGGSFSLTLAAVEGNLVYAYGARDLVRDDLVLEARLRDDRGEGWDIHFSILRSYFQSGDDLMLHLNVVAVEPRTATRLAARAHVAELATARVLYAHSYERAELFDVRLADASPTGAAFVTERRLATGDLLELETYIEDQVVRFEVRVVHTGPAVYGRNRVGSEITTILEADRHLLLRLAKRYQRDDSAEQRDPDLAVLRTAARSQQSLNRRRAPRKDARYGQRLDRRPHGVLATARAARRLHRVAIGQSQLLAHKPRLHVERRLARAGGDSGSALVHPAGVVADGDARAAVAAQRHPRNRRAPLRRLRLVAQLGGLPDHVEQADQRQLQAHGKKHHHPEVCVIHGQV